MTTGKIGWFEAFDSRYLRAPSVVALIAANLLPLVGVLYWGWDLFGLMLLYWAETGIIGFFAILQIALTAGVSALFFVPFFMVHFGGFMLGHLFFLTVIFGHRFPDHGASVEALPAIVWSALSETGIWLALAGLFLSHAVSFVLNVFLPLLRNGIPPEQGRVMTGVYGRVVILHLTLILGATLVSVSGSALPIFLLLIALKTAVDLASHVRKNFVRMR